MHESREITFGSIQDVLPLKVHIFVIREELPDKGRFTRLTGSK